MGPGFSLEVARALVVVAPAALTAVVIRRGSFPALRGAEGVLATVVFGASALLLVAHVTGALGHFDELWMAAGGLALLLIASRVPRTPEPPAATPRGPIGARSQMVAAVALLALVAGQWATRVAHAYGTGVTDYDSLHYHLPFAARFAQSGELTPLHYANASGVPNVFHPADTELIHSLGMLTFGNDVASPLVNLGWSAVALLAAWCIGAPRRAGAASMLGLVVVLSLPITAISAGSALSDVPSYALLLTCVAFLTATSPEPDTRRLLLAGLAAGLALSTKLTVIAPIGVLTLGVLWHWRHRVRSALLCWIVPLTITGSFWYLRNLAATGSPIPSIDLPGLPYARFDTVTRAGFSVASYLGDASIVREWFVPGLSVGTNRAWPVLLVLLAVAFALSIRRSNPPMTRLVGLVIPATTAVYLVTPTSAMGPLGEPLLFALNIRYVFPAVVLALVLLPTLLAGTSRSWTSALMFVYGGMIIVSLLGGRPRWPGLGNGPAPWVHSQLLAGVLTAALLIGAFAAACARRPSLGARSWLVAAAAVATVALAAGTRLDEQYAKRRYVGNDVVSTLSAAQPTSVGIAGFDVQYELYGSDLANRVQYIGERTAHGGFDEVDSCQRWRRLVTAGGYEYLVIADPAPETAPARAWTSDWGNAREVARDRGLVLFVLRPGRDATPCA